MSRRRKGGSLQLFNGRKCDMDTFLVFTGDREFCIANRDRIGGSEFGYSSMNQIRTVDAEKTLAQQVLPLADAGLVAIGLAGGSNDADLGIVGLHIGDVCQTQGYAFSFREESDSTVLRLESPANPLGPVIVADRKRSKDKPQKCRVDEHGGNLFLCVKTGLSDSRPYGVMEKQDQDNHRGQHGQRQVHFVHRLMGLGHQILECQSTGAEQETDQKGLARFVVQADQDGRQNGKRSQPISNFSEHFHFTTKIDKICGERKPKDLAVGFDRPAAGFNFGEYPQITIPLQQTKNVLP